MTYGNGMFDPRQVGVGRSILPPIEANDALICERSLLHFAKRAWHHSGQPTQYQSNWHLDCMADHLMAIGRRELKGPGPIIFTLPPRHMKSRLANVFFPGYVWAQEVSEEDMARGIRVIPGTLLGAGAQFAYISWGQKLSNEHSTECSALIQSSWYQQRWGDRVKLVYAQIEKFTNTAGGKRQALTFSGGITGFGADYIWVDDAHDIMSKSFEADRINVIRAWDEAMQSRLNDPNTGIFVVMMQRSAPNDLIGHILAREFDGLHICLPAEFERKHPYVFLDSRYPVPRKTDSSRGTDGGPRIGQPWRDFRTEGEPLWKTRFPKKVLEFYQRGMTSHAIAGQYQLRPTAREGGMFKLHWFDNAIVKFLPEDATKNMVRSWDLAATAEAPGVEPDWTVGLLMARDPTTKIIYIVDIIRGRYSAGALEDIIKNTAMTDGDHVRVRVPQDPGASGKWLATNLVKLLQEAQCPVSVDREDKNKAARAEPFAGQCERGLVKLIEGPWNQGFIEELCAFTGLPGGTDDQVDAASGGYKVVAGRRPMILVGA